MNNPFLMGILDCPAHLYEKFQPSLTLRVTVNFDRMRYTKRWPSTETSATRGTSNRPVNLTVILDPSRIWLKRVGEVREDERCKWLSSHERYSAPKLWFLLGHIKDPRVMTTVVSLCFVVGNRHPATHFLLNRPLFIQQTPQRSAMSVRWHYSHQHAQVS